MFLRAILCRKPAPLTAATAADWFARSANCLLNSTSLVVGGMSLRLTEVEVYYNGPGHADPFAHRDPIQLECGRWYFHPRGGSYKGLDITFGDGVATGGWLIRGLESPDGTLTDGPSLVVDALLARSGYSIPAVLKSAIGDRTIWDATAPIHLVEVPDEGRPVLACARVGLSLKRVVAGDGRAEFLTRPYRYLTEPRCIAKGNWSMVLALHREGRTAAEIRTLTGCPAKAIAVYVKAYQSGKASGKFEDYFGKATGPIDLCRLHGISDRG